MLETILSIALAAIIMFLVGTAIDLHLRMLDGRRGDVEEAQLARALLRRLAEDLRGVVFHEPQDFSSAADGGSGTGTGQGGSSDDSGENSGVGDSSSTTQDVATLAELPPSLGLYGNRSQIQFDVSRIPRPDEYVAVLDTDELSTLVDVVSDVKTIAYYVQADDGTQTSTSGQSGGGLYRRVVDRMVTSWATSTGNLDRLEGRAKRIAPEVTALEFLYFDGIEWLDEWDSDYYGGLPLAVQIAIQVASSEPDETGSVDYSTSSSTTDILQGDLVFRLTVNLPTAQFTGLDPTLTEQGGESL